MDTHLVETVPTPGQASRRVSKSKMKSIFCTGIFQIIGGTILILCGFVLVCTPYYISYRNGFDNSVCGIWSGAIVLITGIIGVLAASRKSWLKAYLALSLVSVVMVIVVVAIGAVAAAENVHYYKEHPGYHHYDDPDYPDQHGISLTKLAFHLLLCVVGSLELVVCILAAVFCCTGICPGDVEEKTIYYSSGPSQVGMTPNYHPPNYAYPPTSQQPTHIDVQSDEIKR